MDTLISGGRNMLALQALFAGVIYVGGLLCDVRVGELSLTFAGLVAIGFIVVSICHNDLIVTGLAGSSLSAIIVLLSASVGAYMATGIFVFLMFVFAMIAARLAQQKSGGTCHLAKVLVLALPVIGFFAGFVSDYLDRADKPRHQPNLL